MKMLGAQVAAFRRAAGLTQRQLAERVIVAEESMASIEQGRLPLKLDLARALDEVFGVKGVLEAGVDNIPEIDQFPLWAEEYMDQEREAISLSLYANQVLPGLLQTREYARAVLRNRIPPYDADEVETKTAARVGRQEILHRKSPPMLSFVVWEPVLRMHMGSPEAHANQLAHLRTRAKLPGLSLQFMLLANKSHAGLDGPFVLLETPDHQHLAYNETQRGSQWVSDPDEVSILEHKYAMLRTQALSREDSLDLLDRLLGEQ